MLELKKNQVVLWGDGAMRNLVGSTSAEKRETYITWYMGPHVAKYMLKYPKIKAMWLGFAQYWNDEAEDAVHECLLPASSMNLEFEELWTTKNKFWKRAKGEDYGEFTLSKYEEGRGVDTELHGRRWGFHWNNWDLIKAFAAYTREGGSQEEGLEQYQPYMKFYWHVEKVPVHNANGEKREERSLIGEILTGPIRPWLDDVPTNWEVDELDRGEANLCQNCTLPKDQHADGGQCLFESSKYRKDPDSPFWFRKYTGE